MDHLPIALRRTRRSSIKVDAKALAASRHAAVARTPRKPERTVRFAGLATPSTGSRSVKHASAAAASSSPSTSSSGLTPFMRRTTVGTPSSRRRSGGAATPTTRSGAGGRPRLASTLADTTASASAPLASVGMSAVPYPFASASRPSDEVSFPAALRQTRDGRVERRMRRSGVRDALCRLDQEHRRRSDADRLRIGALREALEARERELKSLKRGAASGNETLDGGGEEHWTMMARDPDAEYSDGASEGSRMDVTAALSEFGDESRMDIVCSTPRRAAAPVSPPESARGKATPALEDARVAEVQEAILGDGRLDEQRIAEQQQHQQHQQQVEELTSTLDAYKAAVARASERLSAALPSTAANDATQMYIQQDTAPSDTLARLDSQVTTALNGLSDRAAALAHLTSTIQALGFPGDDASGMLAALTSALRNARLELEYAHPGESALPLTSHGAEVLDLVLERFRAVVARRSADEAAIDEYHELERDLRRQLADRVEAMDGLRGEVRRVEGDVRRMEGEAAERAAVVGGLEVANERLKGAVKAYIRDVSELEQLVERMEGEAAEAAERLADAANDNTNTSSTAAQPASHSQYADASQQTTPLELEARLAAATARIAHLVRDMDALQDAQTRHVAQLNRRHGQQLAVRDARTAELRAELAATGECLREAHRRVQRLRAEAARAGEVARGERRRHEGMTKELDDARHALAAGVLAAKEARAAEGADSSNGGPDTSEDPAGTKGARASTGLLSGELARRRSGRKRKHDGGTGLLEEDQVDI